MKIKPETWQLRLKLISRLGGKCVHCGQRNPYLLEFDHRDGEGQHQSRTQRGHRYLQWMDRHFEEALGILQLLCANCHRLKTLQESQIDTNVSWDESSQGVTSETPVETQDYQPSPDINTCVIPETDKWSFLPRSQGTSTLKPAMKPRWWRR